ncbi:MAG TPA: methyltransferase domain-containing protein [Burkholderiaceae bacterium]|nr:methyltransferase domain-containing protein [Burkholderiaceae bacterium]
MDPATHTYNRSLRTDNRSSLSVVASYVPAHSKVLDIGTGSGALGQHLCEHKSCTVDGITYNPQEAEIARAYYRKVEVLDIEGSNWPDYFSGNVYDCIVCADVLEHLKDPAAVIRRCADLLSDDGILIISIPNISYAYFIAELIKGEFEYGPEGLLDRSHLRFFTRRSFERLIASEQWFVSACEPIWQPWFETEFRLRFDDLPPNVGEYLLAQPDAGAYQWVFVARKAPTLHLKPIISVPARHFSPANFLAQIYITTDEGLQTHCPINTLGNIGELHQALTFPIPAELNPVLGIRLDVADRTGFMRIHSVEGIDNSGQQVFNLSATVLRQAFATAQHHLADITPDDTMDCLWLRLTGDDPHFHLPLPIETINRWSGNGRSIRVWCSWPWSADYQAACQGVAAQHSKPVPPANTAPGLHWSKRYLNTARDLLTSRAGPPVHVESVTEIVIPVFNSLHLTRRCLESVITSRNEQPLHITVINDASTQAEVRPWLAFFASQHPQVTVVENAVNLGFVRTVNLGMRMAGCRDAVLLNSDTQVTHHWLDRLRVIAYSSGKTASVTPFSNNATICSFPDFCADNPFPSTCTLERINQTAGRLFSGQFVPIPTAVGFCMYIKRAAWAQVGEFDAATFGLGYGEENDWCMRAASAGWRHQHALDVYVAHQGGASFSEKRQALQASALENLLKLHPDYNDKVQVYVKTDPGRAYREALALALNVELASGTSEP